MGHVTSPSQGIFSSQERRGKSLDTRLGVVILRPTFLVQDKMFRKFLRKILKKLNSLKKSLIQNSSKFLFLRIIP
jgi:hypothetical protein